jgi:hypothetical protein
MLADAWRFRTRVSAIDLRPSAVQMGFTGATGRAYSRLSASVRPFGAAAIANQCVGERDRAGVVRTSLQERLVICRTLQPSYPLDSV